MEQEKNIENLISKIKKLDTKKIDRVDKIVNYLLQNNKKNIKDIRGVGSDIWEKIDIDEYISVQRKWD